MAKSDESNTGKARSARDDAQLSPARQPPGEEPNIAQASDLASEPESAAAPPTALSITSHRELIGKRAAMVAALTAEPDRARLLFANPALAFREAGVKLSPAVANHIMHVLQQPPRVRARREELTAMLKRALGSAPRPSDPKWLAETLFGKLRLHPLQTSRRAPQYMPVIPADAIERLRALLPKPDRRLPARPVAPNPVVPVWRLDLDAQVPTLPRARRHPKTVSLPELWFYLPVHELVHPLLELGILEVSVMRTLPPDAFAKVRDREIPGGFIDWIDSVSFPRRRRKPGRRE
jgi:hypothetical protein